MPSKQQYVYILRTCDSDMTSRSDFKWPKKGKVVCPDWRDDYRCGGGLRGLLWGEGNASYLDLSADAKWLVVKANMKDVRHGKDDLTDKCKFKKGTVVFCGKRDDAVAKIVELGAADKAVVFKRAIGGDGSVLTGGYESVLTGGNRSKLTGGEWSKLTGCDQSVLTGGDRSSLTGGHGSSLTGGHYSKLTGGDWSSLTGGHYSILTGGDWSSLEIIYFDGKRQRRAVAYVGEKGIKADTPYTFDANKKEWVEVKR